MCARISSIFCATLSICLTQTAFCQTNSPYALDWVQSGFLNQRDYAAGIVVDSQDNPSVAGTSGPVYGSNPDRVGDAGALIAKYDSTGTLRSLTMAYPTQGNLDHVLSVEMDRNDNAFIIGFTYRYPNSAAYVVKVDANNTFQWERHLQVGDPRAHITGHDMEIDGDGNLFLVGSTTGSLTGAANTDYDYDPYLAKYTAAGELAWVRQYAETSLSFAPLAITMNQNGLFLVGPSPDSRSASSVLTRVGFDGALLESATVNYATSPGQMTQIFDMTSDSEGNIYTCGITDTVYNNGLGYQGSDAVVAKHNPRGDLIWQRRLETGEFDAFASVAVDALGDVYVAGDRTPMTSIIVGDHDAIWAKFDRDGNLIWQETYETEDWDEATAIAVDSQRNVYVTGWSTWTVNDYSKGEGDVFLFRYKAIPEPQTLALAAGFATLARRRRLPTGDKHWLGAT